jgi:hypothetical protein
MSHDYAMSRVRDALEKAEGNHLKAQRLILAWLEKDHTLLFGLVTPHLQSIVSHAVNHTASPPKKMPKHVDVEGGEGVDFGAALMRGMKGESVGFGEAAPRGLQKPGKTSQRHIDAINKLVSRDRGETNK